MNKGFSQQLAYALAFASLCSGCNSSGPAENSVQHQTQIATTPPVAAPQTPITQTPTPTPTSPPCTPVPTTPPCSPTPQPDPSSTPTSTPSPTPSTTPPSPLPPGCQPVALVYGGPGVMTGPDDTLERAKFVADAAGFKVVVVTERVDPTVLDSASVWIQPGGPSLTADKHMNSSGMTGQVRDFVKRGGGFVGLSGGAFSALNNLDLVTGKAHALLFQATKKIPIKWSSKTRYVHFEHGPYFSVSDKNAEIIGTYANGSAAVVRSHFGKGVVYVSGVNPEANSDWAPTADPDGSDVDLAIGMIREVAARPSTP